MIDVAGRIRTLWARRGQPSAEAPVETFSRQTCDCGAELVALREAQGRSVACTQCGAELYVLAANRWPQPLAPRGKATIDWEPGGHAPPPRVAVHEKQPAADEATSAAEPAPQTSLAELPEQVQAAVVEHVRQRPLRWIALGALVLIVATGAWSWRAARRRQAAAELGGLTAAGVAALDEGQYARAADSLRAAARAAADLPGDSPAERRALQFEREALIWSRLAQFEPADFFLSRARGSEVESRREWPGQFNDLFSGRSVVFDAWVRREIDVDWAQLIAPAGALPGLTLDAPTLRMDWSIVAPPLRLEVVLPDDPAFRDVRPGEPRRVVFGARLAALRASTTRPTWWLVELVRDTCVPLTIDGPLARQGWPVDDASQEVLKAQARALGVTP